MPSEVYQDYLDHPRDYELIFSFRAFQVQHEQEEIKKAQKGRFGR